MSENKEPVLKVASSLAVNSPKKLEKKGVVEAINFPVPLGVMLRLPLLSVVLIVFESIVILSAIKDPPVTEPEVEAFPLLSSAKALEAGKIRVLYLLKN